MVPKAALGSQTCRAPTLPGVLVPPAPAPRSRAPKGLLEASALQGRLRQMILLKRAAGECHSQQGLFAHVRPGAVGVGDS